MAFKKLEIIYYNLISLITMFVFLASSVSFIEKLCTYVFRTTESNYTLTVNLRDALTSAILAIIAIILYTVHINHSNAIVISKEEIDKNDKKKEKVLNVKKGK